MYGRWCLPHRVARIQQQGCVSEGNKMLSCFLSQVSSTHDFFFAAAVEQKQTVLVLGGLVAHSWTRGAEFLAMVNYRSLWETPKYEPPTLLLKVALTNSGDVKWNSLFSGQRGRFHHLHRLSRQPQCETPNSREQADIRGRKTTRI